MVKIFVGGFPLEMTELEIVKIVSPHGQVSTIKIVRDKKTRICKGYAFLEMVDEAAAKNAINMLDGTMVGVKVLTVKFGIEKKAAPVSFSRPPAQGGTFTPKFKRPRRQI